jgi:hypothetical protein
MEADLLPDGARGKPASKRARRRLEWLRRGGMVTLAPLDQPRPTFRRWLKQRSLTMLPIALAVGIGLGWLIRAALG